MSATNAPPGPATILNRTISMANSTKPLQDNGNSLELIFRATGQTMVAAEPMY